MGAANPFADPFEIRVPRLAKKIAAGVEFIQTQCIYNLDKFEKWMKLACDRGLHEKVYILAGLTPMKSVGMARYMKNRVPGMDVPDEVIKRLADTPKEKQAEEGVKICIEDIQRLKEVEEERDKRRKFMAEVTKAFDFRLSGEETLEGVAGIERLPATREHPSREAIGRAPRPADGSRPPVDLAQRAHLHRRRAVGRHRVGRGRAQDRGYVDGTGQRQRRARGRVGRHPVASDPRPERQERASQTDLAAIGLVECHLQVFGDVRQLIPEHGFD